MPTARFSMTSPPVNWNCADRSWPERRPKRLRLRDREREGQVLRNAAVDNGKLPSRRTANIPAAELPVRMTWDDAWERGRGTTIAPWAQ